MRASAWLVAAVLLTGCASLEPTAEPCVDGMTDAVTRHVDGDTLDTRDCGRIRLALVDTPEREEAGYAEASALTARLCPVGSQVVVDLDAGQPLDSTGTRRVAVLVCGGENLNARLVHEKLAIVLTQFCGVSEFADDDWAREACR